MVGVGRAHAPQVRWARAPAGRAPTSRSRSRAIAGRERNTVPEDGAPRAESDGRVFPVPDRTAAGENRLLWYNTSLLHPKLPRGFNTWTQVLSDWAVSRVWRATKIPPCLEGRPELAAPFVAEISAAIRHRQIPRWADCFAFEQTRATVPAFDRAGGPAYAAHWPEMRSAQLSFFSDWHVARSDEVEAPVFDPLSRKPLQTDYDGTRSQHEPVALQAAKNTSRASWHAHDPRVITDTYFADEPPHAPAARMARIHPPWWGAFHLRLQKAFRQGHPAEGHLLDALPEVRRQAGKRSKLTLEATVSHWWQDHHDRLGWYCKQEPHYRMIARRAAKRKAPQLIRWLDRTAPGYRLDQSVRVALHAELAERLRVSDPQSVAAPSAATMLPWGEHGAN